MSWGLIAGISGAVIGGILLIWLLIRRRKRRIEQGLPVWSPGDLIRRWRDRRK